MRSYPCVEISRVRRCLITAATVLACFTLVQVWLPSAAADTVRQVEAQDGTFSVSIPVTWNVQAARVQRFGAWGPQGQSVAWGMLTFIDRLHYEQYQAAVGPNLAQQVYRLVSDPLPPRALLHDVLPHLNPGVQSLEILGEKPVLTRAMAAGSFILYRYMLVPGAAHTGAVPPPLAGYHSVAMEGAVLIETTAPNSAGIWTWEFWGAAAPADQFSRDLPVFDRIFRSLHYDIDRILQVAAAQQHQRGAIVGGIMRGQQSSWQQANATITQFGSTMSALQQQTFQSFSQGNLRSGEGAIAALGGPTEFKDGEGNSYSLQLGREQQLQRYQCVNGYGAAARYYGSNTDDCTALGAKFGVQLRPLTK